MKRSDGTLADSIKSATHDMSRWDMELHFRDSNGDKTIAVVTLVFIVTAILRAVVPLVVYPA